MMRGIRSPSWNHFSFLIQSFIKTIIKVEDSTFQPTTSEPDALALYYFTLYARVIHNLWKVPFVGTSMLWGDHASQGFNALVYEVWTEAAVLLMLLRAICASHKIYWYGYSQINRIFTPKENETSWLPKGRISATFDFMPGLLILKVRLPQLCILLHINFETLKERERVVSSANLLQVYWPVWLTSLRSNSSFYQKVILHLHNS